MERVTETVNMYSVARRREQPVRFTEAEEPTNKSCSSERSCWGPAACVDS